MNSQRLPLTRREFLYYVWAASVALFTAETAGALFWLALPRFKPGLFGAGFTIPIERMPLPDSPPLAFDEGRFWLVNVGPQTVADPLHPSGFTMGPGLLALDKACTHLGCTFLWYEPQGAFVCPCHGSKFLIDGTRVHGPAARDLDRYQVRILDINDQQLSVTKLGDANADHSVGFPITSPPQAAKIIVETGRRIQGRKNDGPNTTRF